MDLYRVGKMTKLGSYFGGLGLTLLGFGGMIYSAFTLNPVTFFYSASALFLGGIAMKTDYLALTADRFAQRLSRVRELEGRERQGGLENRVAA